MPEGEPLRCRSRLRSGRPPRMTVNRSTGSRRDSCGPSRPSETQRSGSYSTRSGLHPPPPARMVRTDPFSLDGAHGIGRRARTSRRRRRVMRHVPHHGRYRRRWMPRLRPTGAFDRRRRTVAAMGDGCATPCGTTNNDVRAVSDPCGSLTHRHGCCPCRSCVPLNRRPVPLVGRTERGGTGRWRATPGAGRHAPRSPPRPSGTI
jgi:hypothetical protein